MLHFLVINVILFKGLAFMYGTGTGMNSSQAKVLVLAAIL